MHPDAARIAHLLRRTGFGPVPGEVEAAGSYDDTLATILAGEDDGVVIPDPHDDEIDQGARWWLRRMRTTPAPLHEKMVLFWHSHLASSADKASGDMLARQHDLFRRHALGNFRELMHQVVRDAAMLTFLDGAGSDAGAPNENMGRELMELFALGRGAYTQADVRAAARALAGFTVDWDSEAVGFDEDAANTSSLTFLGVMGTFDADRLVDVICDQSACAPFVAAKVYRFFVGVPASDRRLSELASGFATSGLEIRPLVEAILGGPEFVESRLTRPRFPVEWLVAALAALDREPSDDDVWEVGELGQRLFFPPNVAGWSVGPQWVSPGRQLLRSSMSYFRSWPEDDTDPVIDLGGGSPAGRVTAALARCGLFEVSAATRAGLEFVAGRVAAEDGGDQLVVATALASPEAACC